MCSNFRNDVPRVAQRYGTIAAHTRCRASVLFVFVVFCVHMYSFAGLIRRTPPPTFSDTAITDRHSDTTIFQLRAHWVRISWSIGSEKLFGHVPPVDRSWNFTVFIKLYSSSGRFGVRWPMALSLPYLILPLWIGYKLFRQPKSDITLYQQVRSQHLREINQH